ncbi:hypothetical protein N9C59_06860 [Flavobacteriales bacterium]|nr:hypothetical protein [Flavobacteriales bacterium]
MKKLMVFMFSVVLLGSCVTVSRYSGEIYPANVTFERPNFKYIKTVTGTSDATFSGYGWDVKKVNGIVNEAKQNLYQQFKLKENQAPTNFTLDFVRVGEPTGEYLILRQLKAVLTADIFEFSDNGVYSYNQITNQISKPLVHNNEKKVVELENLNVVKKGFTDFSEDVKLKKETKVLFHIVDKYYKAVVNYRDYGKTNVKDIEVYNNETKIWNSSEKDNATVPNNTIIGYKL